MPLAMKACITVTAGVIPNERIDALTRTWSFTDEDITKASVPNADYTYLDGMGAAMNYAATLQNPQRCNWVKVEWIWL